MDRQMFKVRGVAWQVQRKNGHRIVEHRFGVFDARGLAVAVLAVTLNDHDETGKLRQREISQQICHDVGGSRAWLETQRQAFILEGWTEVHHELESFP